MITRPLRARVDIDATRHFQVLTTTVRQHREFNSSYAYTAIMAIILTLLSPEILIVVLLELDLKDLIRCKRVRFLSKAQSADLTV